MIIRKAVALNSFFFLFFFNQTFSQKAAESSGSRLKPETLHRVTTGFFMNTRTNERGFIVKRAQRPRDKLRETSYFTGQFRSAFVIRIASALRQKR